MLVKEIVAFCRDNWLKSADYAAMGVSIGLKVRLYCLNREIVADLGTELQVDE